MKQLQDTPRNHTSQNRNTLPEHSSAEPSSRRTLRRILALAAIVLLVGLYLMTFFLGILGDERSAQLLRFCFGLTIFLPLFLWVVIWCIGYIRHKKSMASLNILDSNPAERERMEEAVSREMDRMKSRAAADPGADDSVGS